MKQFESHTGLVFFSRTSAQEASRKKLFSDSTKQNYKVVDALIQRSHKVAEKSGLPLFVFTEEQQTGSGFGEKLSSSVQSVFDKGFDKLIIIGNDCPHLTSKNIQEAAFQLKTFDQVLAPTKKGGVSLMGFGRSNFNKKDFEGIRWQTSHVYNDIIWLANSTNTSIFHFPFLNDVNNNEELQHELTKLSALDSCKIFIQSILASFYKRTSLFNLNFFCNKCLNASGLRAPPAAFQ